MLSEIDFELEAIRIGFEAGQANALDKWQTAFEEARRRWQSDRA